MQVDEESSDESSEEEVSFFRAFFDTPRINLALG